MRELCDLDAIGPDDLSLVGGKALSLGRMIRLQLPVPPGFCVTTTAFESHRSAGLSESLNAAIHASCMRLNLGKVAVRSSATSEDGAITSFAGQQETLLSVEGERAVCEAIVQCWDSLFSKRAVAYRERHGATAAPPAMAVVVQQMVPAEVAGVIFTCDPRRSNTTEMLVEASWGLGESVVSGRVTPDRWSLDRVTGQVCHQQIATKLTRLTLDGIKDVAPEQQQQSCLTESQLRELAELARQIATVFGEECDIEWAWAEGRFWILQARPITTADGLTREQVLAEEIELLKSKASPEGTIWSRINLAEVLPSPTPMTWSVVRRLLSGRGGFGCLYRDLGFDPDPTLDDDGVYDLAFGRPYCNLSREPRLYFRDFPLEHPFEATKADPRKALTPQPALNPSRLDWKFWVRLPITLPLLILRMVRAESTRRKLGHTFEQRFLEEVVPGFVRDAQVAWAQDLAGLPDAELWAQCEAWQQRTLVDFARDSLKPTVLALLTFSRLEQRLQPGLGSDRASQVARELIMNVRPFQDADFVQALHDVAQGRLTREVFLSRFGHRGQNEMELAEPRWNEVSTVRATSLEQQPGKSESFTHQEVPFEETWARIAQEARLSPPVADRIRQEVVTLRSWVRLRETAKHYFMHGYAVIRRYLCELDRRFRLDGGIFFLTTSDIPSLLQGADLRRLIANRRRRHQLTLQLDVPAVLFSDDLDGIGQQIPTEVGSTLQGIPLSAGRAQAPAVVLTEPTTAPIAGPYVLVCPSTDPAWVPLFAGAVALVMETGGVLSHGAIVAREFGLPAIAGIPGIQHKVTTGQLVHIDGEKGTITITDLA